jgi:hypothetical protein
LLTAGKEEDIGVDVAAAARRLIAATDDAPAVAVGWSSIHHAIAVAENARATGVVLSDSTIVAASRAVKAAQAPLLDHVGDSAVEIRDHVILGRVDGTIDGRRRCPARDAHDDESYCVRSVHDDAAMCRPAPCQMLSGPQPCRLSDDQVAMCANCPVRGSRKPANPLYLSIMILDGDVRRKGREDRP